MKRQWTLKSFFRIEVLRSATNVMVIKVRHTQARCDFEDIPPGTYALAVLSAPSFSAASFPYDGRSLDLTIRLTNEHQYHALAAVGSRVVAA